MCVDLLQNLVMYVCNIVRLSACCDSKVPRRARFKYLTNRRSKANNNGPHTVESFDVLPEEVLGFHVQYSCYRAIHIHIHVSLMNNACTYTTLSVVCNAN